MYKSVTTAPDSHYMHTVQTYTHIHIFKYIPWIKKFRMTVICEVT